MSFVAVSFFSPVSRLLGSRFTVHGSWSPCRVSLLSQVNFGAVEPICADLMRSESTARLLRTGEFGLPVELAPVSSRAP